MAHGMGLEGSSSKRGQLVRLRQSCLCSHAQLVVQFERSTYIVVTAIDLIITRRPVVYMDIQVPLYAEHHPEYRWPERGLPESVKISSKRKTLSQLQQNCAIYIQNVAKGLQCPKAFQRSIF